MVNVTINMSMEDFEYIKKELQKAYENTNLDKKDVIEKEKIDLANAQISHVLNKLGC